MPSPFILWSDKLDGLMWHLDGGFISKLEFIQAVQRTTVADLLQERPEELSITDVPREAIYDDWQS